MTAVGRRKRMGRRRKIGVLGGSKGRLHSEATIVGIICGN
jgi:hypothetical protein